MPRASRAYRRDAFDPKRASQTILVSASFSFLSLSRLAACARLQLRRSFEAMDVNASAATYGRSPMFVMQALYT
jgi:hypothetical protein